MFAGLHQQQKLWNMIGLCGTKHLRARSAEGVTVTMLFPLGQGLLDAKIASQLERWPVGPGRTR